MLKFSVVCLYFAVVAVNFWNVNCITEEEKDAIIESLKPITETCVTECGLTEDDFKKHKTGDHDDMNPCFKKCFMQKIGFMNEEGKYDREGLREAVSQYEGDKKDAEKFQDKLDSCFDANGDNDGDDEEAQMKRVDVLFKCLKDMKE